MQCEEGKTITYALPGERGRGRDAKLIGADSFAKNGAYNNK